MIKRFIKSKKIYVVLLFVILTQGCVQFRLDSPSAQPTARDIEPVVVTDAPLEITVTPTALIQNTPVATATEIIPTNTSLPRVTITAVKGNIYIRRGPGMAYNPIGVLYKNTSTDVIARDVLSNWVQVVIPDSDKTGWISVQTEYSQLDGEYDSLPDFTFTDWPVPAYLYNCTEHDMYIMPGEIILTSYFTHPNNQVWIYPGSYTVYDYSMSDLPEVRKLDIREGVNDAIIYDGTGVGHKCP